MKCAFCKNKDLDGRTIFKNKFVFAFLTNTPIVPGHTLICPIRHVTYYEKLTQKEKSEIEKLREKIKKALEKSFGAKGFNYAWNEEEIGGQSVPHFHLHVVPRKKGDAGIYKYEPRKFLYRPGARKTKPQKDLESTADEIRQAIQRPRG